VSVLRAVVSAGECGPLVTLSGEADVTTAEQLSEVMTGQLATGIRHLTVDAAGLAFADSMSVHILLKAAQALAKRGGGLLLLRPQRPVATVLHLTGVDQLITIGEEQAPSSGSKPV
jgi:anti-anti-sigma factor